MGSSDGPAILPPPRYWEERARRFARAGSGRKAVCSYGMPAFYNASIEVAQRLALRPWLDVGRGASALDIGCGVGRWSLRLAARGASVTGVDLSPTMIAEARRRAEARGLKARCDFQVRDVLDLDLGRRFDLIVSVTVLQHIVDAARRSEALGRLAEHLEPDGRMVLLEAAPTRACGRANHGMFEAAGFESYEAAVGESGLRFVAVTGVDATLPRRWALPLYRTIPRPLAHLALSVATLACLPYELTLARRLPERSWHRVMVLATAEEAP